MIKLNGIAKLSRTTSNVDDDKILFTVQDDTSREQVVSVVFSLEQFADLMTNRARVPCTVEYNESPNIGKIRETRKEIATIADWSDESLSAAIDDLLVPLRADGWQVDAYERKFNHHNARTNGDKSSYGVTIHRYVDPEEVS